MILETLIGKTVEVTFVKNGHVETPTHRGVLEAVEGNLVSIGRETHKGEFGKAGAIYSTLSSSFESIKHFSEKVRRSL